ncbi:hypothetical protein THOM_2172 [Trachipleistophora hominis]|uniref:Uncharacterized protein n=1 Tax=Trachipleistophora hominis TaxID=72359 RepID=L7JV52_TRAHO|nr:hypothetical protein THOM_2172 [Trachipleistophora hominis]
MLLLIYILLSYQATTLGNTQPNLPRRDIMTKVVRFHFYISPYARARYINENRKVEDLVQFVAAELERALNLYLEKSDRPVNITFVPIFVREIPPEIELDKCDTNMLELATTLNNFNLETSDTSIIAVLSCDSRPYEGVFITRGQEVPYITHSLSSQCTTRTLIFLEIEEHKFLAALSTAMIRAAGVDVLNPLLFEEVINGDAGVRYDIRVNNETMDKIKENMCFYNH